MAISSIHFQGIKENSEGHNKRLNQNLDYVFKELSPSNRNFIYSENIEKGVKNAQHAAFLKKLVKEKTGRSVQARAHVMQEGVFNFNPEHTDKQIFDAARLFCKEMNLRPVRLSIHRDEGHKLPDGTIKLNLHAHLTVEWIDRSTGKSHKWNREDMSKCQTVLAECLNMQRGKKSTKTHLSALEYKLSRKVYQVSELEESSLKSQINEVRSDELVLLDLQNQNNAVWKDMVLDAHKRKIIDMQKVLESTPYKAKLSEITAKMSRLEGLIRKKNLEVAKQEKIAQRAKMNAGQYQQPKPGMKR